MSYNYDGPLMAQQILKLQAERDALKVALEMMLGYEPNCCVCGDEACNKPTEVWATARAALKAREVKP